MVRQTSIWKGEPTPEPTPKQEAAVYEPEAPGYEQKAAVYEQQAPGYEQKAPGFGQKANEILSFYFFFVPLHPQ